MGGDWVVGAMIPAPHAGYGFDLNKFIFYSYSLTICAASFHRIFVNYTVTCVNGGLWQISSIKGSQLFTTNGTFFPPLNVTTVYVLLIGGGGGGTFGDFAGGSGGYVSCGSVNVSGMININVIVGTGGQPSDGTELSGGLSSFGSQITASGGKTAKGGGGLAHNGANGGSGSGYSTTVQT